MRTNSRSGGRALVLMVLTLVVSLSERAQAQQSGLFPLAPIRRERPPCQNEDPVYKYYKQQYFGYHPTYWRRFPAGWGVPSQEAPDKEKSFREFPPEGSEATPPPAGEGMGPAVPGGGRMPVPNLPEGRSPFETDTDGSRTNPAPRGNPAPQPAPPATGSPFDDLRPGAAAPSRRSPRTRAAAPSLDNNAPELTAPAGQPEQDSAARASGGGGADDGAMARGTDVPLLAIDDIDVSRSANAGSLFDSDPIQPPATANPSQPPSTTQPPPRRGFISSLFGGMGMNWFRR